MSRGYIPRELRRKVSTQARRRCGYCLTQEIVVGSPMEIDHLIPQSRGGRTEEKNLWLACSLCNDARGSRIVAIDPASGEIAPLYNPRQQDWRQHFRWSDDATRIIGLTATGRATVLALRLNRASLVHARAGWVAVGWHPPLD
jgi:hypothetical protein